MLQQEKKPSYAGGILGDDMGLGKVSQSRCVGIVC
jgi:hypothetical protein